ncbi:MAG TPA: thioredoxin [archaeon]|nr:thioredoxin [archaeon]
MKELMPGEFAKEATKGNVILYYSAIWCQPCRIYGPIVEDVSKEIDKAKFLKVDVEKNQDIAMQFQVMSVPTLIFLKDGKQKNELIGAVGKAQLKSWIEKNL